MTKQKDISSEWYHACRVLFSAYSYYCKAELLLQKPIEENCSKTHITKQQIRSVLVLMCITNFLQVRFPVETNTLFLTQWFI